jgi:hypothetical protein
VEISTAIEHIIQRFSSRVELPSDVLDQIANLPIKIRSLEPSTYVLREGQRPQRCAFIVDGFAYRQKLTPMASARSSRS